jgi:DNA-binding response OmpR family regulator
VAMRCWRERPVDLIITDILMPEKDGLELIREVRRAAPGTKVIAMSGGGPQFHVRLLDVADRLGAARTLQKPFAMNAFIDTVNAVLHSAGQPGPKLSRPS